MDMAGLFRHHDALAHESRGKQDLAGGDAAGAIRAAHQALADDGAQRGAQLHAHLFLLWRREDGDDTVDRFYGVQRVQGGEDQVAGFGGVQRSGDGFQVAHFAHQDHVRVLAQAGAQRRGKRGRVHFDFTLVDESFFVAVQKFDGVFDRDDVLGTPGVDAVNHSGQGR